MYPRSATRSPAGTTVWGTPASDQGRFQAWFEYSSQLGELLDLEFVGLPVYSWGCAAGHALRMAARITGRSKVLVPRVLDPERRAVIGNYCASAQPSRQIEIETVGFGPDGRLDLADLRARLTADVAAVYVENPNYFGLIEGQVADVVAAAAAVGAEVIAAATRCPSASWRRRASSALAWPSAPCRRWACT